MTMTRLSSTVLLMGLMLMLGAGCNRQPNAEPPDSSPKPVVNVPPVPTRTFEEGYEVGFEQGRSKGAPRAKMPDPDAVERIASEEATGHPDRTERWQRGFIDGYIEGFRNVVTGKK
jgi:hypothetical protein